MEGGNGESTPVVDIGLLSLMKTRFIKEARSEESFRSCCGLSRQVCQGGVEDNLEVPAVDLSLLE